jgi:thymidylate kinase
VRAGYLAIARRAPQRVKVVPASRPVMEIQREIRVLVEMLLAGRGKKQGTKF